MICNPEDPDEWIAELDAEADRRAITFPNQKYSSRLGHEFYLNWWFQNGYSPSATLDEIYR
jgi:hypothetical protein